MTRPRGLLSALLGLALFAAGCAEERPRHLLLISIDTLRADALGAYGGPAQNTPFLDELARRGVLFENAVVNTHGTTPSHTTMLSGVHQQTHRVGSHGSAGGVVAAAIPADLPLLPELLRAAGFRTVAVTGGGNVGAKFGFARGFDVHEDRDGHVTGQARRLRRHVAALLAEEPRRSIFAFLHTYEVHSPYDPPPEYRRRLGLPADARGTTPFLRRHASRATTTLSGDELALLRRLYDAEVRYTDDTLRTLFTELDELGFLDDALVVVTADHGEEFGEHGGLLHRGQLYEELLRVPLLAVGPGLAPGRDDTLAATVDIVPTVLDALGLPAPSHLEGRALLRPGANTRRAVVAQYGDDLWTLRQRRWKLIESAAGEVELYDLPADPGERRNLAAARPAVRDELRAALRRWREADRPRFGSGAPVGLDAEDERRLRALGYLGP